MSAKQITFEILEGMQTGEQFTGAALEAQVRRQCHQIHYPSTMLRYMREWRTIDGRKSECIDKPRSLYQVTNTDNT